MKFKFLNMKEVFEVIKDHKDPPVFALGMSYFAALIFLVGIPKGGKSTFLEGLAYNLLRGVNSFMGMETTTDIKRIGIANFEENFLPRSRRNFKQISNFGKDIKDYLENLLVFSEGNNPFLSTDSEWDSFFKSLIELKLDLLIIDSMARLYLGSLENSSEAQLILKRLRFLVNELNIPVIVLHHTVKLPPNQVITLSNVAGSRLIGSEADFILGLGKTHSGIRYIKPLAYRYTNDEWPTLPTFNITDNGLIEYLGNKTESELFNTFENDVVDNKSIISDYLKDACSATTDELIKALVTSGRLSRSSLFANLTKLVNSGTILKNNFGYYKHTQCEDQDLILDDIPVAEIEEPEVYEEEIFFNDKNVKTDENN